MIVPHTSSTSWSSGTRALRFVTSAHIPTGKLQWKRRHVSARILHTTSQDWCYCSTAHRQAKGNSRNLFSVAITLPSVNLFGVESFLFHKKPCRAHFHNSTRATGLAGFGGCWVPIVKSHQQYERGLPIPTSASTLKNSGAITPCQSFYVRRTNPAGRVHASSFSSSPRSCFRFGSQFDALGGMQWHLDTHG